MEIKLLPGSHNFIHYRESQAFPKNSSSVHSNICLNVDTANFLKEFLPGFLELVWWKNA